MLEGAGGFSGRWPLCRWVVIAGGSDEVARAATAAVETTIKAAEEAVAVAAAAAAESRARRANKRKPIRVMPILWVIRSSLSTCVSSFCEL